MPFEVGLQVFKILILSHLTFSRVYIKTLSAKNIQRRN